METVLIILTLIVLITLLLVSLEVIKVFNNQGTLGEIDFTMNKISFVNINGELIKVFSLSNKKLRRIINTHFFGAGDIMYISMVYIPKLKIGVVYNIKHYN